MLEHLSLSLPLFKLLVGKEEVVFAFKLPWARAAGGKAEREGEDRMLPEEFLHNRSLPDS